MDASENKRSIAVVTGASGGFGKEFVRLLLEEDTVDEIWAVARNKEKLQKLSDEFGSRICVIPMDLTHPVERWAFAEKLEQEKVKIQFLVNNAGYAKFCAYDELGVEESLNMLELNCNAVVAMGLFCIPYMEQGSHIVNIASLAAFLPLPYLNLYSASKAFVRNYSRALNVELKQRGITVTAVCPGWMHTALFERADIGADHTIHIFRGMADPGKMAEQAFRDVKKKKDCSIPGSYAKMCHVAAKILPQKWMMKLWMIQQKMTK